MDDGERIFDNGTPWDYVVDLGHLVDRLVTAHNKLAEDHEKLIKRQKILEAKIQELRRKNFG